MKRELFVARFTVIGILALFSILGLSQAQEKKPAPAPPPTIAAPGNGTNNIGPTATVPAFQPASEDFLKKYDEVQVLVRLVDQIEKEAGLNSLRQRANIIIQQLNQQIPSGMKYDETRRGFVPLPAAPPPAPPAERVIPVPTPAPAKKP